MPAMKSATRSATRAGALAIAATLAAVACTEQPRSSNKNPGPTTPPTANDAGTNSLGQHDAGESFATCASAVVDGTVKPVDLLVLLDRSGSMAQSRKWFSVVAALKSYFASPASADVGLGLQLFPGTSLCDESKYAIPKLPISRDSQDHLAVGAALDAEIPDGETPMAPALWGAVTYAHEWAKAHPERSVAVVLATDGLPDQTCQFSSTGVPPNTIDGVAEIARRARALLPSVSVAVIGVGSALADLDRIAQASGTGTAAIVADNVDRESVFLKALEGVTRKTLPCEYSLENDDADVDITKLNLAFEGLTFKENFVSVGAGDACEGVSDGWYFDDPNAPTKVELCPDTCRRLQDAEEGRIRFVLGCNTVIR